MRKHLTLTGSIALAMLLGACSGHKPRAIPVEIRAMQFVPAHMHARIGDTLVVTNHDIVPHTATARDSAWDTGSIAADSTKRVIITKRGTFFCTFHPTMTGKITDSD